MLLLVANGHRDIMSNAKL